MRYRSHLLAIGAAVLALSVATSAGAADREKVAVPERGVYLGAYVQARDWRQAGASVAGFESSIGRRLAIDNRFFSWDESFPTELHRLDVAQSRIPMITWKAPALDKILSGSQDAMIAARADAVRRFGAPLFIRWGWEMNGYWTEWSGVRNNSAGAFDGPGKYVRAWRRIHDIFQRSGATNVSWVWAPNGESVPNTHRNRIGAYYPGDAYVDWVGLSAYNWGSTRRWSHWESFARLVRVVYSKYATRKPIMVAETGSVGRGAKKACWIAQVGLALRRYSTIKAVLWFERPPEWTVRSPDPALSAFRRLVSSARFRPAG
jgi:hypothetical protein